MRATTHGVCPKDWRCRYDIRMIDTLDGRLACTPSNDVRRRRNFNLGATITMPTRFAKKSETGLLIAEDHPLFTDALVEVIRSVVPGAPIETVTSLAEARAALDARPFRLALIDLMLPDSDGLDTVLQLRTVQPGCPIAVVSARENPEWIRRATQLGLAGYIPKSTPVEAIRTALIALLDGEKSFPAPSATSDTPRARSALSPAEQRILASAMEGQSNKAIAGALGISEATVKSHFSRIFRKLGVHNRTQALLAIRGAPRNHEARSPSQGEG